MRSALSKVSGVISADVSMPDKAEVKFDSRKTTQAKLIAAVKKAGGAYSATVREAAKP